MNDTGYRKRLAEDLPKWRDAGWVNSDGMTAILGSLGTGRRSTFGIAAILGTLGALLIGLGVVAFVGANWEEMPRLFRLGLIVLAMAVAYGAAFAFDRNNLRIFAEAGALAAGLVFAGAIALVGQTYHMSGDFEGAVLLFEIGILGAALMTGSLTLTVVGLAGAGYWTWLATIDNGVMAHWPSLVAIVVGLAITTFQNSYYGRIVAIIALMYWIALTIAGFGDTFDWSFAGGMMIFVTAALAFWSLGAALASLRDTPRLLALGDAMLWPGLLAILVAVGILQIAEHPARGEEQLLTAALIMGGAAIVLTAFAFWRKGLALLDVAAVAALAVTTIAYAMYTPDDNFLQNLAGGIIVVIAALWAVQLGQSGTHPIGKAIGLAAFGIEVIYLYIVTLGTLLDTALAFLLGGVLFIVLSFALYRIDRMLARGAAPPPAPNAEAAS